MLVRTSQGFWGAREHDHLLLGNKRTYEFFREQGDVNVSSGEVEFYRNLKSFWDGGDMVQNYGNGNLA